jgi:hypothetical protein
MTTAKPTAQKAPVAPPVPNASKSPAPKPAAGLSAGVGSGAANHTSDVRRVQELLNKSIGRFFHFRPFKVTGHYDLLTNRAISEFQRTVLFTPHANGQIHPHDQTDEALHALARHQLYIPKVAHHVSGGKFTSHPNEVVAKSTHATPQITIPAFRALWSGLTENGARTLTAQFLHETHFAKNFFNWNLGTVKCPDSHVNEWKHVYLRSAWEIRTPVQAKQEVAESKGLASLADAAMVAQKDSHLKPGEVMVTYLRPHPESRFCAYDSFQDGARQWIERHKRAAGRHASYLNALNTGNTLEVAKILKKEGYATHSEKAYAEGLKSTLQKLDMTLGPAVGSPFPAVGPR